MKNQPDIRASILDRLIDLDPEVSGEPVQRRFSTFTEMREAVIRDLENLLNTRARLDLRRSQGEVTAGSVAGYGMKDLTSHSPGSASVRQQIRAEIERNLRLFEPRLREVTVRLESSPGTQRSLHFQVTALLVAEPITAPVTFDTCVDTNSGTYSILRTK